MKCVSIKRLDCVLCIKLVINLGIMVTINPIATKSTNSELSGDVNFNNFSVVSTLLVGESAS